MLNLTMPMAQTLGWCLIVCVAAGSCSVTVRLALEELSDLTVTEDLSDCVTEAVKPGPFYAESLPVASRLPPFWLEWRCHSCQPLLGCRDLQAQNISAFMNLLACEMQEWQACLKAAGCCMLC